MARFLPGRVFYPISLFFAGTGYAVICVALAIFALVEARWAVAAFLVLSSVGVTGLVEAPMWLWTVTAGRLNPKYGIAKRMFGTTFPFEAELEGADNPSQPT